MWLDVENIINIHDEKYVWFIVGLRASCKTTFMAQNKIYEYMKAFVDTRWPAL